MSKKSQPFTEADLLKGGRFVPDGKDKFKPAPSGTYLPIRDAGFEFNSKSGIITIPPESGPNEDQKKIIEKWKRGKYPESKMQQECVKWFYENYPEYEMMLFAIPNGGGRTKATRMILAAEGVVPGVADLFLAVPSIGYSGLFIEMKIKPNKPSQEQAKFMVMVIRQGYNAIVCYSKEEFITNINNYLLF